MAKVVVSTSAGEREIEGANNWDLKHTGHLQVFKDDTLVATFHGHHWLDVRSE